MWLVVLNYKVERDWLIELSDNNLTSEQVKKEFFWTNHNRGNCNFFDKLPYLLKNRYNLFFRCIYLQLMKPSPRMSWPMFPRSSVIFSVIVNPPDGEKIVSFPKVLAWFLIHPYFYLRRSVWISCVTLSGVPSPLSRNRCLILSFLSSLIQYSRQTITLCYRYSHGYRGQNFSHSYYLRNRKHVPCFYLAFYDECRSLIGFATHCLFCDWQWVA